MGVVLVHFVLLTLIVWTSRTNGVVGIRKIYHLTTAASTLPDKVASTRLLWYYKVLSP